MEPGHRPAAPQSSPKKSPKLPPMRNPRAIILVAVGSAILVAAIVLASINLAGRSQSAAVRQTNISQVLSLVDQHKVRSAVLDGNQITVTANDGTQYSATKEDGQQLTQYLRDHGVANIKVPPQSAGTPGWAQLTMELALFGVLGVLIFLLMRRNSSGGAGQAVPFGRSKAVRFNETHPTVMFKDVAGVEEAKDELQEIVHFLKYPEKFRKMGARIPKGVLLVGPPGTGKTLISRAVAGEAGVAFYSVSGSEFVEMFVGVGASRVRDLFKMAKENAPCIIFIDEIDAVGRQRGGMPTTGNDEREQTLNQLLVEMDGFDKHDNVVVIGATNRPDVLDQALLRPGRFDRQVMLEKPDLNGRIQILDVHAEGKPLAPTVSMDRLARQTTGMSGADLANVLNEAALLAARRDRELIEQHDLEESILRVMAGPERKSHVLTEAEKAIVAYHEMGHAIVMRRMPGCDQVQKVSTVSRGMALGITVQAPTEDRSLLRKSELLAKLAGLMGGRAAEEIIFGDITTGAAQDIKQATSIARRMVREFGMSPLGNVLMEDDSIGPQLAAKVDTEVQYLVDQAYATAKDILERDRDKLVEISEHLMQVETIDGGELDRLLFRETTLRVLHTAEEEDTEDERVTLEEVGSLA
ncbi:MAG: Cell division-associated, ATP-dependent zinc metalloprotease FtsH [Ktedonobacterales bacterium]|jgi:cell division protease FtsH|nr:MAG: Cell division-associated, ATP-dependent zinc metalloprotease FtsH [Ktedonobacterales bacterium]